MPYIPWRVKNFISEHFPLFYHLAANAGAKGNSTAHWDARLASTWDEASRDWPTKNDLVAALTNPTDAILDVGCGTGGMLRALKRRGYQNLHGLELSQYAIGRLRDEGIAMHFGKLPSIPLPDCSYDVVIASQVLEHVILRGRFLREIGRVLKPAGHAFIFVPDNCLGPIDESEHVIKFNARSLRKLLEGHFAILALESMRDAIHPLPILYAHVEKRGFNGRA